MTNDSVLRASLLGVAFILMPLYLNASSTDCENFNSAAFFSNADLESIQFCLDDEVDLTQSDESGYTPLFHAVSAATNPLVVDLILDKSDSLGIKNTVLEHRVEERSVAHIAASQSADPGFLIQLVKHEPDITSIRGECGPGLFDGCVEPLHVAAAREDGFIFMATLLSLGADLSSIDNNNYSVVEIIKNSKGPKLDRLSLLGLSGWTQILQQQSLNDAGPSQHVTESMPCSDFLTKEFFSSATLEMVQACVSAGSNPRSVDRAGNSSIHLASSANPNPAVIDYLLGQYTSDVENLLTQTNLRQMNPLHLAAESNTNPAIAARLIAWGADVNGIGGVNRQSRPLRADVGATPLHLAASRTDSAREEMLTVLLAKGPNMRLADHNGYRAIHLAGSTQPDLRVIELLQQVDSAQKSVFERRVSTITDNFGSTALHHAVARNAELPIIKAMTDYGFSPDARNINDATPLLIAAQQNSHPDVFFHLLRESEDPCHKDSEGRSIEGLLALNTSLSNYDSTGEQRSPLSAFKERCPN
jgi:ankyrin repeat protein